ncbi:MAG: ABC transporter ATP-binding protein [Christensenellales bacterium]|jgi:ATP-binding cassette subfamily B multidrug efflux pump
MEILKRILALVKPYRKQTIVGIVLLFAAIGTRLVVPYLTRSIVDDVIEGGQMQLLTGLLIGIAALTVCRAVCTYIRAYLFEDMSQGVMHDMRRDLFRHLNEMSFRFYDQHRIGEIMSRMTGDIDGVRNLLAGGSIQLIENATYFIGSIVLLFTLNVPLTLLLLIVAPFLAWIGIKFRRTIHMAFRDIREQNAVLNTRAQENISGVRVVKAFAREEYEKEYFQRENFKQRDLQVRSALIWGKFFPMMDVLSGLTPAILLLGGGIMVIQGHMSLGTLVAMTGYIWMITGPMRMLGQMINNVVQAIASAEKIFYYVDLGTDIKDAPGAVEVTDFKGHVRFDHVSFRYGDEQVLRDINLDIPAGSTVAIMGATGTGKSSLVNLLGRYYECNEGVVSIDGVDVKDYKLKQLRRQVGCVMQETFLFSETVFENIAFGDPDVSMEQVVAAARAAEAAEFIDTLPEGYDTIVGERGTGLSGGQRQRVAIARALLYNPGILVLDDATSSVDMETEYEIQKHLETIMKNRTTFIIAHRISSVKDADMIVVLQDHGIAEQGTHQQLLEKRGLYYQMYQDQYRDFEQIKPVAAEGQVG